VKIVIFGCGRVGAVLAESFDATGHEVIILDTSTRAFDRLSGHFRGNAVRGDGTDEDTLRRAGAGGADAFLALTEGDNRNVMAAQVATENLGIPKVIAKINDPVRAAAYAELGIAALCRTTMMSDAANAFLGFERSGMPSVIEPTRPHHADHAATAALATGSTATTAGVTGAGTTAGLGPGTTTGVGARTIAGGAGREG
jgi:trk system potassium uptake protein TrkA